VEGKID
jgi:hypothetical protein